MNVHSLRGRLTLKVPEAGELIGLGRDASYDAVERGDLPSIKIGRRKVVPTHALLRQLGWPDDLIAQVLGLDPRQVSSPIGTVTIDDPPLNAR